MRRRLSTPVAVTQPTAAPVAEAVTQPTAVETPAEDPVALAPVTPDHFRSRSADPPAHTTTVMSPTTVTLTGGGDAPTTALAAPVNGDLAELFDYKSTALVSVGGGLQCPTIRVYSGSEGKQGGQLTAQAILAQLGGVPVGTSYLLGEDGECVGIPGAVLLQMAEMQYWAAFDASNNLLKTWLTPQGRGVEHEGERVQEVVVTLQLLLPGMQALVSALEPAQVTLTHWRGAMSKAPVQIQRGIEAATKPEWAKVNGSLAGLPPRMRVVGSLQTRQQPTRDKKFLYTVATAMVLPLQAAQFDALSAWGTDEECQTEFGEARALYDEELASIAAQAQ